MQSRALIVGLVVAYIAFIYGRDLSLVAAAAPPTATTDQFDDAGEPVAQNVDGLAAVAEPDDVDDEFPAPPAKAMPQAAAPGTALPSDTAPVTVQFCTSWSYAGNFRQVKSILETVFPDLRGRVVGGYYPPPAYSKIVGQAMSGLFVATLVLVFAGDYIFQSLGMDPPALFKLARDNKIMTLAGVWILNNMAGSLSQTGAFEIEFDGHVLHSKLSTGQMPTVDGLIESFSKLGFDASEAGIRALYN